MKFYQLKIYIEKQEKDSTPIFEFYDMITAGNQEEAEMKARQMYNNGIEIAEVKETAEDEYDRWCEAIYEGLEEDDEYQEKERAEYEK